MAIRTVSINSRTQVVRLPAELHLPEGTTEVTVRARGHERIICPIDRTWDSFFLNGPAISDDFPSERALQLEPI